MKRDRCCEGGEGGVVCHVAPAGFSLEERLAVGREGLTPREGVRALAPWREGPCPPRGAAWGGAGSGQGAGGAVGRRGSEAVSSA